MIACGSSVLICAVELYGKRFPKAVAVFEAAIDDTLSHLSYLVSHHPRISMTNMLERLFEEVKKRMRVVGVLADEVSASTLADDPLRSTKTSWVSSVLPNPTPLAEDYPE
jgi:putative transposase